MEPFDPHVLRRQVSAFVDGELDATATNRLLEHLVTDPGAMETLRRFQQLTAATRRAVRGRTPSPSDSLRESLQQLTDAESPSEKSRAPVRPWWAPLEYAAAAIILIAVGVWAGRHSMRSDGPPSWAARDTTSAEVIPAVAIAQAEEVHGFCSRLAEGLHTAGYPAEVAALASSVQQDLQSDHPYPDFGAIGYRYRGAGPCGVPLGDTVHLLYRSTRPGSVQAISVFVQPWRGQFALDEGKLYTVSVATTPFPMLAWRTDRVVYFLVGDDATTVRNAAKLIRGAPTSRPSTVPQ